MLHTTLHYTTLHYSALHQRGGHSAIAISLDLDFITFLHSSALHCTALHQTFFLFREHFVVIHNSQCWSNRKMVICLQYVRWCRKISQLSFLYNTRLSCFLFVCLNLRIFCITFWWPKSCMCTTFDKQNVCTALHCTALHMSRNSHNWPSHCRII
jgi:hypothetical protein